MGNDGAADGKNHRAARWGMTAQPDGEKHRAARRGMTAQLMGKTTVQPDGE